MKKPSKKYIWEKYVSPYIRQRDANFSGYCRCISCNKVRPWKEMDAGHFIRKSKGNSVYFLEDNIHAQCTDCNRFGSMETGHQYGENLKKKIGEKRFKELYEIAKDSYQMGAEELNTVKDHYKQKLDSVDKL